MKKPPQHRMSVTARVAVLAMVFTFLFAATITVLSYFTYRNASIVHHAEKALGIANATVSIIDPERFYDSMQQNEPDDYWHYIRAHMDEIFTRIYGLTYLYIIVPYGEGQFAYFMSATRPGEPEFVYFMQVEQDLYAYSEHVFAAVRDGAPHMTGAVYSGHWGVLICGFAPIIRANGQVLGLVGADYTAADVLAASNQFGLRISGFALLVTVLFGIVLTFSLYRNETKLTTAQEREREINEANRQLAAENAALDSLSRMKTEFITNITHEAKTPLSVISVHVQQAQEVFEELGLENGDVTIGHEKLKADSEMINSSLKKAQAEIMRVSRLVNNVLWVTSAQESREHMKPLDIGRLIENGAEAYRGLIAKQGNALTINAPANLPQIFGDADQLLQVMANVLTNANNHTRNGAISVSATAEGDAIKVTITDNGTGIDAELLPRVFERGVTGSASAGGTGMGLPISRSIVESHGGIISIDSTQDKGTTVTFTIPVYDGERAVSDHA